MSENQEPRIRTATWSCSDVPLKKRKYLVQPQLPAIEAGSTLNPQPNEQRDTSVGRGALDSSNADENQKMVFCLPKKDIGEPTPSLPSVSVGNDGKAKSIGDLIFDQSRVKVEAPNSTICSSPLAGFEIPSNSSNILGSSLHCSLGMLPVGAEHPAVVVSSDKNEMKAEKPVLKTHEIARETCDIETLRGECQTEEPTALYLSLSKGACAPHDTDSICTKSGNQSGVDRLNWDLNTTMDAWKDDLDISTTVNTTGVFSNSNESHHDIATSSCHDTIVIAKPIPDNQEESVGVRSSNATLMQFDNHVNPACSLSLGLSSYALLDKLPSVPAIPSVTRSAFTSFPPPIKAAGNVKPINLRSVKSEIIEESVREETESAQGCPIGLSNKGMKLEVVGSFIQGNSPSSGILKPLVPISIKTEPNTFPQPEVLNRKDGTVNHPHSPIMQSYDVPDLPTGSTPYQKDRYIPCSSGISNAPMSSNRMTLIPSVQGYPDCTLKEDSGQNSSVANGKLCEQLKHGVAHATNSSSVHGDHNLNISGVNVTSLTEEKILDDCKTCESKELPRNSRETDELSVSDKEKIISSGKELEEQLYNHKFESDCGHDLSTIATERNLYDEGKVQGPAAVFTEGSEVAHAKDGGSETEQRNISVPYHGDFQNSEHVEENRSHHAVLGNTGDKHITECSTSSSIDKFMRHIVDKSCLTLVEIASTEVHIKKHAPEVQTILFDGSGENEGRIVQDGEGMSGVSNVSEGIENTEILVNNNAISYKAEMDNDLPMECSDGGQSRVINLAQVSNKSPDKAHDAADSFVPVRVERDRFPNSPFEPRKYPFRESDESCKFSRESYRGKIMRSPRQNFMSDRRRDNTESNLHDQDTKNFEFDNHGNTRRGGAFMSNFQRGRRHGNDEVTPYSHSFSRRGSSFSFNRGQRYKEDASAFHGFRDGEKLTRGLQCDSTEPVFMNTRRPYRGRSGFARGQTKFLNPKRGFPGFRSRSPVRSRERSDGPSSSFRNRSQEDFSGNTDFSHRRSPSGYKMERVSSPDNSGYSRERAVRRHNSPPFPHRSSSSNAWRGRGYARGRGYTRGRGYGRDGNSFRKPSDRFVYRNHGNLNNLDPQERVNYSDDFCEGPTHSERFGVDGNTERRRFGYRHDDTSSFRRSFTNDGCAERFGPDPHMNIEEQGSLMENDGENQKSTENASERTKNMEEEETSNHSKIWQQDEGGGDGF